MFYVAVINLEWRENKWLWKVYFSYYLFTEKTRLSACLSNLILFFKLQNFDYQHPEANHTRSYIASYIQPSHF